MLKNEKNEKNEKTCEYPYLWLITACANTVTFAKEL
jgi:hypothetical protein